MRFWLEVFPAVIQITFGGDPEPLQEAHEIPVLRHDEVGLPPGFEEDLLVVGLQERQIPDRHGVKIELRP